MHSIFVAVCQRTPVPVWVQGAKWGVQTISGIFLLLSFLITYRHSVKVRAGDLLLKLEETFNKLGSKLDFLEYKQTCYEPIKGILARFRENPDNLLENERRTLGDIDECIRFLYICSLHAGEKIHYVGERPWTHFLYPSRLPHAYYYYLNKLNDNAGRPELYAYVRDFFPAFSTWLTRNKDVLACPGLIKTSSRDIRDSNKTTVR